MRNFSLKDIIYGIRKRPSLYLGDECISSLSSFITGWTIGAGLSPKEQDMLNNFQKWIEQRYRIKDGTYGWVSIILFNSANDHTALQHFFELFDEFFSKKSRVRLIFLIIKRKMITLNKLNNFLINNESINFKNCWYHYKQGVKDSIKYDFLIKYSEKELINVIEKYAGVFINEKSIEKEVIEKDKAHRSMGLFWYIFQYLEKESNGPKEYNWNYVINNINNIILNDESLTISGQASKWE